MWCVVGDRIEFVVAHDDLGTAPVDHALDGPQDAKLIVTAIDQVADEDCLTRRMCVGAGRLVDAIVHLAQERIEFLGAAVDVADDVVALHDLIFAPGCDMFSSPRKRT